MSGVLFSHMWKHSSYIIKNSFYVYINNSVPFICTVLHKERCRHDASIIHKYINPTEFADCIFPYSSIAYCTIIGSSYSAHIDLFSSSFLSCSISSSNNLKSKISRFCFIRSLWTLLGITTIPLCT